MNRRSSLALGFTSLFFSFVAPMRVWGQNYPAESMSDERFWAMIDLIPGPTYDQSSTDLSRLTDELSRLPATEIQGFFETLARKLYALDTRAHYRAFSWFPGESDPFLYARLSVVGHGRAYYERMLGHPAEFPSGNSPWLETLLYVADTAYLKVTGTEFTRESSVDFESFSNSEGWK